MLIINICISDLENRDGDLNINETKRKLRHLKSQNAKHQQLILFFSYAEVLDEAWRQLSRTSIILTFVNAKPFTTLKIPGKCLLVI